VLRRIFGPKRGLVTVEWRRLHFEELNDLYSSPNIIRVIKSRITRWVGMWHVWKTEGDLMERSHLEDIGLDDRIILKWFFSANLAQGGDR